MKEHRQHQRIEAVHLLSYKCMDKDLQFESAAMGRTLNVSNSGVRLETSDYIDPAFIMSVEIGIREKIVEFVGKVVYCRKNSNGKFESGIHFFKTNKISFQLLRQYINDFLQVQFSSRRISNAETIQRSNLLDGPPVDYLSIVAEESFFPGDTITRQGKHGNWVWVILEGQVEVCCEAGNASLKLYRIGPGSVIGSLRSLAVLDNVRRTSTIAVDNVHMGLLDLQHLSNEYKNMSADFKATLLTLDKRLNQLRKLAVKIYQHQSFPVISFDQKKPLIEEGSNPKTLFRITKGEADLVRYTGSGYLPLGKLGAGDIVGKLPYANSDQPAEWDAVYASSEIKLYKVSNQKIIEEYNHLSQTMRNMAYNVAEAIQLMTRGLTEFRDRTDCKAIDCEDDTHPRPLQHT